MKLPNPFHQNKSSDLIMVLGLAISLLVIITALEFTGNISDRIGVQKAMPAVATFQNDYVEYAEENAHFPGGFENFSTYILENLKYPDQDVEIEGKVVIRFIVEKDGFIEFAKITQSLSPACDEEALRIVKDSPRWIPARNNGKPVRQILTLPINFKP